MSNRHAKFCGNQPTNDRRSPSLRTKIGLYAYLRSLVYNTVQQRSNSLHKSLTSGFVRSYKVRFCIFNAAANSIHNILLLHLILQRETSAQIATTASGRFAVAAVH